MSSSEMTTSPAELDCCYFELRELRKGEREEEVSERENDRER